MDTKRIVKIVTGLGCFALLLCLIPLVPSLLLGGMLTLGAERTIYERAVSPDGWHEARVQFDDAGAVSSFARLVFIKHRWTGSDEPLLSCRAFWGAGEEAVHLHWIDSGTLLIQHAFPPQDVEAVADRCGPIRIVVRGIRSAPDAVGKQLPLQDSANDLRVLGHVR